MDAHRITYAWLLTWIIGPDEEMPRHHQYLNPAHHAANDTHPGIPLQEGSRAAEQFPGRFVLGYCPHPSWREAPALLEAAFHMHGVRVCGEWKYRQLFDDPRSLELFRTAGRLKMPVVLHLDVPYLRNSQGGLGYTPQWYGGTVANLERALEFCPDTTFIGHAPGFWREISGDADDSAQPYPDAGVTPGGRLYRLFARYPNLYADLSAGSGYTALARDPAHAVEFIARHADRLLFGRDYYEQKLHNFLRTLSLPIETVEKIYWRNAECLVLPPEI